MARKISEQERQSRENYKKQVDETFSLPTSRANSEADEIEDLSDDDDDEYINNKKRFDVGRSEKS